MRSEDAVLLLELVDLDRPPRGDSAWVDAGIRCSFERHAGRIEASFPLTLPPEHLADYAGQLEELYRTLDGEARLWSVDPGVDLVLRMGSGKGEAVVKLQVAGSYDDGITRFTSPIDQTYLPEAIAGCRSLLELLPPSPPRWRRWLRGV